MANDLDHTEVTYRSRDIFINDNVRCIEFGQYMMSVFL